MLKEPQEQVPQIGRVILKGIVGLIVLTPAFYFGMPYLAQKSSEVAKSLFDKAFQSFNDL